MIYRDMSYWMVVDGKQIGEFEIVAPLDYEHSVCLKEFKSRNPNIEFCDERFIDENFSQVERQITPGMKMTAKIFHFRDVNRYHELEFDDFIEFYYVKKAIFVGVQGLVLLYEQHKNELPLINNWFASFDQEEGLFKDEHGLRIPALDHWYGHKTTRFDLRSSLDTYPYSWTVVCFCEKK